jgi:hypothetical protein
MFIRPILITFLSVCYCYQQQSRQSNHSSRQQRQSFHDATTNDYDVATDEGSSASAAEKYLRPFSLGIADFEGLGGVRGIQSKADREEGDLLLKIPLEDSITSTRIPFSDQKEDDDGLSFLLQHADGEEERLALYLLWIRDRKKYPYVTEILPKMHYSVWTLPQDLWEEVAAHCLPRCYVESFQSTRDRVLDFCQRVSVANQQSQLHQSYSLKDCLWAFSMVRSRSIAVPELQPETIAVDGANSESHVPLALIPGLDLFNHAFGAATHIQLVQNDDGDESSNKNEKMSWVVYSTKPLKEGDQVFLSYGDDKDNWKLLLTYGFSIPSNPNSIVFWSWRDLLDTANKIRPTIFTERVCSQLMNHPQLQQYSVLSENRATFSFDAVRAEPRESLSNGLLVLVNLAAQLGHLGDEKLGADVLAELIRQRELDLVHNQVALKSQLQYVMGVKQLMEWKPFLESLHVALELEASALARL